LCNSFARRSARGEGKTREGKVSISKKKVKAKHTHTQHVASRSPHKKAASGGVISHDDAQGDVVTSQRHETGVDETATTEDEWKGTTTITTIQ
jgi:hypothetical protein